MNDGLGARVEGYDVLAQRRQTTSGELHEFRGTCAPRQGLEAQSTGAGEQVEAASSLEIGHYDAHPRSAHAVRGRSNAIVRRRLEAPSLPLTGYDAQPVSGRDG